MDGLFFAAYRRRADSVESDGSTASGTDLPIEEGSESFEEDNDEENRWDSRDNPPARGEKPLIRRRAKALIAAVTELSIALVL